MADDLLPHERPVLLVLPRGLSTGEALARFLQRAEVAAWSLPPLWCLEPAGVDLVAALPGVRALTRESLPAVLEAAERLCTPQALEALAQRVWSAADEHVRQHFLQQGALRVFASIFRLAPRTAEQAPPPAFVAERVREHRLEVQYRLARRALPEATPAPAEEGSLIAYPFDASGDLARQETRLPPGGGVLEAFAYAWDHERHRALWQAFADEVGAQVVTG